MQGADGVVDVSTMKKEWAFKKETKKAKQEDAPIVIWESESTTDEEYPTGQRSLLESISIFGETCWRL